MHLLKSQKSFLYDMIVNNKLSPTMFEIKDINDQNDSMTILQCKNSAFFFTVSVRGSDSYNFRYSPGDSVLVRDAEAYNWELFIGYFYEWLRSLKREIDVVDKWQLLENELPNITIVDGSNQDKFSYDEVSLVAAKVNLLKSKLAEIPLTADQIQVLNEKLDYCIELSKTANKFDWGSYFIGVITNVILTLSVSPDNAHMIWVAVKHVFNNFLLK
jgi:hypothetical protein